MNIPRVGTQPSAPPASMANEYPPRITSGLSQQPPPPPPPPPPYSLQTPYPVPPPTHHHTPATAASGNHLVYIVPQAAKEEKDQSVACLCTKCMCSFLLLLLSIGGIALGVALKAYARHNTHQVNAYH